MDITAYSNLLFDMDGTLTAPRQPIDPDFAAFLLRLCEQRRCYIVTGSDYRKVHEQLGTDLCKAFTAIYACNGNLAYEKNRITWWSKARSWQLTGSQLKYLQDCLDKSKFWLRTGNHIEQRVGCANFSIVGRKANVSERDQYRFYDQCHGEREKLAAKLRKRKAFSGLDIVLGGETGIDIFPRGHNKAQIKEHLLGRTLFIGDRCEPGGNDFEIAHACEGFYAVKNWRETWALLTK